MEIDKVVVKVVADTSDLKTGMKGAESTVSSAKNSIKGSLAEVDKSVASTANAFQSAKKSVDLLNVAIGGTLAFAAIAAAKNASEMADKYTMLNARLKLVSSSAQEQSAVYDKLLSSSKQNFASLESEIALYTRLSQATSAYGVSAKQIVDLTDAVTKTFRISGASAAEAAAGALQFGQALGSGKLAGDEFKSISENNISLLKALADSFGVTTGELKKMAEDGLLTTGEILKRLPSQFDEINQQASSFPVTLGGAFSYLGTSVFDAIGKINEASQATSGLSKIIISFADNMDVVRDRIIDASAAISALIEGFYVAQDLIARTSIELQKPFMSAEVYAEAIKGLDDRLAKHLDSIKALNQENKKTSTDQVDLTKKTEVRAKAVAELTSKQKKLLEQRKDLVNDSQVELEQISRLNAANKISEDEYDSVSLAIDRENVLRKVGLTLKSSEGQRLDEILQKIQQEKASIDETNEARKRLQKTREEEQKKQEEALKKAQDEFEEPFKRAGENIQKAFAESFAQILDSGKINFQTLADEGKRIMLRMVAEVATAMIFKPVIQPVLAQAMAGFSAAGGGGGMAGNLSSLGALGGLGSIGAITSALNNFGAAKLGFSNVGKDFVGPLMPGQTAGTTLSRFLGGGAMGLGIGSMNLFGGNQMGSTIGGTLGGLGGSFFGLLGSLAGSAIGSGLGGLFGPGAKVSAAEFAGSIGANDNLGGLSYGAKNGQIAQARGLSDALGQALAGLVANGIDIANTNIRGAINSKSGNRFEALGQQFSFDPQDTESVSVAIAKMSIELAKAGNNSGSLAVALQNMQTEGRKAEEIISDLNFAAGFDKLGEAPKKISETEQAIKDLHDRFAEMRKTTERLGLDVAKLNAAEANLFANIRDEFNKSISGELLQATNSQGYAIAQEFARFNQQLEDAKKLGADINLVQQLHNQKMTEILGQQQSSQESQLSAMQSISDEAKRVSSLFVEIGQKARAAITGLNLSSTSALSPEMKYAEARRIFEDTRNRAMLGDTQAGQDLPATINDFLEQSRNVNASNAQYKEDFAASQSALSGLADLADRQVISLAAQVDKQQKQVDLLQQIANNTSATSGSTGGYSDASLLPAGKPLSYLDSMTAQGVTVRQYHTLARVAGYGGEFGQGGFDAFAKSNPQAAALFNQLLQASGGTMRTFAGGGRTPAGMPFLVGEKGPEILRFDTPGTVTPNHRIANAGAGGGQTDNILLNGFSGLMDGQKIMSTQFANLSGRIGRLESSMETLAAVAVKSR